METIKVNMTPCEDIKTIHASQNDNEGREWGFELHNNGEKIDSSSISDQLVFKAYEGGTEQILPENGSTPTTSPFMGDIKYPQGLLSDQEFLYRESPTEEDGLAKITDIKGNTLVWNQLVENGDFSASSGWTGQFATVTISNGVASVSQDRVGDYVALRKSNLQGLTGHKYLVVADVKSAKKTAIAFYLSNTYSSAYDIQANTRTVVHAIITVSNANTGGFNIYTNRKTELAEGDVVEFYHVMLFDLTQMGLDISNPSEFTSLFSLPYYAYNQGTLLSFMGNGIKTVGFNQWDEQWEVGALSVTDGSTLNVNTYLRSKNFIPVISGKTYCRGISYQSDCRVFYYDANQNYVGNVATSSANTLFTIPSGVSFIKFHKYGSNYDNNICINISSDRNGTYEPYTESTLSLPISTYFTNGMKSAGNVYDELTETKAITRIGSVDLGSLAWSYRTSGSTLAPYFMASFSGIKSQGNPATNKANILCSKYQTVKRDPGYFIDKTICADGDVTQLTQIQIKDSSFTDATAFKTAMSGVYLYYELATPIETSFTTASLVTENAEIPLSNEDGILIGKCTEQLSSESGFFDAKIKLADEDGECYSNKLQLHIERSPQ